MATQLVMLVSNEMAFHGKDGLLMAPNLLTHVTVGQRNRYGSVESHPHGLVNAINL